MRLFRYSAFLTLSVIAFLSCQSPTVDTPDAILGVWRLASTTTDVVTTTPASNGYVGTIAFQESGKYTATVGNRVQPAVNTDGLWKKDGSRYKVTQKTITTNKYSESESTSASAKEATATIRGSTLTLVWSDGIVTYSED